MSSPREFKGNPSEWSAEDLFIAAVEICHMQTFLAYAAQHSVQVVSYTSHANGVLEYIDGDYRFTRIVIFPTIGIPAAGAETVVHGLLREAEKHCLVANSIASIVEVNPTISFNRAEARSLRIGPELRRLRHTLFFDDPAGGDDGKSVRQR